LYLVLLLQPVRRKVNPPRRRPRGSPTIRLLVAAKAPVTGVLAAAAEAAAAAAEAAAAAAQAAEPVRLAAKHRVVLLRCQPYLHLLQ
jgi:hypothetical protein